MINDDSVKQVDKAKLTGYYRKWNKADMLIGCALYIDVLKAPSILSLTLQARDRGHSSSYFFSTNSKQR